MTNELLIHRIASGDREAFAAFYDVAAARVFAVILGITRTRAEAEDVLQETFAQVWTDAARYDAARGAPMTWLLQIARSRAIDATRRKRPKLVDHSTLSPRAAIDTSAESRDAREQTGALLRRLSDAERELIQLSFFEGLTHPEIAQRKGLPLGTVKSGIRRSMQQLRAILALPADRDAI